MKIFRQSSNIPIWIFQIGHLIENNKLLIMKVLTIEQVLLAKPSSDSRWIVVRGLLGSIVFGTIESSPSLEVQGHKVLFIWMT